ncbi:MAG: tRNA-binding protein [Gammaproteobacteria bacterium]|jgi:tRNA-binding protein
MTTTKDDGAMPIEFEDFLKVDIRTGTVVEAALNAKARVPAYVLKVDFGELGMKTSSAQITGNYQPDDLVGKQVVAVVNFAAKRVAGVKSEVLILGAVSDASSVVLLEPTFAVENGSRIS